MAPLFSTRRVVAWLAWLCLIAAAGEAAAVQVTVVFGATVTSNVGNATDGVFPPGTQVSAQVTVDSDLLIGQQGGLQPATGSATAAGQSLDAEQGAFGGGFGNVNGASVRQFNFFGTGSVFVDDGNPGNGNDQWQVGSVTLHLPAVGTLAELLALTTIDINDEIAALGLGFDLPVLGFAHQLNNNVTVFESARAGGLAQFAITPAQQVPEPATLALCAAALGCVLANRRRAASGYARRPCLVGPRT